jgi:hypothetical protein
MPIPFACGDVLVIKRTQNVRRRWLRRKRHRHRDNAKTRGDKGQVERWGVNTVMGCGACCCVANSGMRASRPSVGFTLCLQVYMPAIADHFPMCAVGPPWTPGKGSRGNSKALPNSDERNARIMIISLLLESLTNDTCHCAEMTRRIDAEPTAVKDKK